MKKLPTQRSLFVFMNSYAKLYLLCLKKGQKFCFLSPEGQRFYEWANGAVGTHYIMGADKKKRTPRCRNPGKAECCRKSVGKGIKNMAPTGADEKVLSTKDMWLSFEK